MFTFSAEHAREWLHVGSREAVKDTLKEREKEIHTKREREREKKGKRHTKRERGKDTHKD